jgi:hypothetical protein
VTIAAAPLAAIRLYDGMLVAWRRRRNFGGWHRAEKLGAAQTACGIEIPQAPTNIRVVWYGWKTAVPAEACRRCFPEIPAATPDQAVAWMP